MADSRDTKTESAKEVQQGLLEGMPLLAGKAGQAQGLTNALKEYLKYTSRTEGKDTAIKALQGLEAGYDRDEAGKRAYLSRLFDYAATFAVDEAVKSNAKRMQALVQPDAEARAKALSEGGEPAQAIQRQLDANGLKVAEAKKPAETPAAEDAAAKAKRQKQALLDTKRKELVAKKELQTRSPSDQTAKEIQALEKDIAGLEKELSPAAASSGSLMDQASNWFKGLGGEGWGGMLGMLGGGIAAWLLSGLFGGIVGDGVGHMLLMAVLAIFMVPAGRKLGQEWLGSGGPAASPAGGRSPQVSAPTPNPKIQALAAGQVAARFSEADLAVIQQQAMAQGMAPNIAQVVWNANDPAPHLEPVAQANVAQAAGKTVDLANLIAGIRSSCTATAVCSDVGLVGNGSGNLSINLLPRAGAAPVRR